jgi:hypothetical protein
LSGSFQSLLLGVHWCGPPLWAVTLPGFGKVVPHFSFQEAFIELDVIQKPNWGSTQSWGPAALSSSYCSPFGWDPIGYLYTCPPWSDTLLLPDPRGGPMDMVPSPLGLKSARCLSLQDHTGSGHQVQINQSQKMAPVCR